MTRTLYAVPGADDFATDVLPPVADIDATVEIPPSAPREVQRRRPALARYGWLVGLLIAGAVVAGPGLVRSLGWPATVALIWTAAATAGAVVLGRGIRIADQRAGGRR